MAKRYNLNAPPEQKFAEMIRGMNDQSKSSKTGAHGVKYMGETGDSVWVNPVTGKQTSVRDIPPQIEEAKKAIEAAKGDIQQAKDDIAAETKAREAALADALDQLSQLDDKLGEMPDSAALEEVRQQVTDAQEAVKAAQGIAETANQAANAASQAALEAAGIAASKGRTIIQVNEPQGDDRNAANIWIKPVEDNPDTEVEERATTYVYLEDSDEWVPTTSDELAQAAQNALDAREAAQQAQQRAETAISNAATAQSAAEAAQRTANQATTDAREAHNEAVAAQETADSAFTRATAPTANMIHNGNGRFGMENFEGGSSAGDWTRFLNDAPSGAMASYGRPAGRRGPIVMKLGKRVSVDPARRYKMTAHARQANPDYSGSDLWYMMLEPYDADGGAIAPWHVARYAGTLTTLAAPLKKGDTTVTLTSAENWTAPAANRFISVYNYVDGSGKAWGTQYTRQTPTFVSVSGSTVTLSAPWPFADAPAGTPVAQGLSGNSFIYPMTAPRIPKQWTAYESRVLGGVTPEGALAGLNFPAPTASVLPGFLFNYTGQTESEHRVGNIGFFDVTDAVVAQQAADAAQARADDAYTEAASKATPAQVAAAQKAATDAAAADAKAKADAAQAEATRLAALDAKAKADAAQAEATRIANTKATPAEVKAAADNAERLAKEAAALDATAKANAAKAAAALDAKAKADAALAAARADLATARTQITAEIKTSANGKNAIKVSTDEPSGSGGVAGDTWWRVDGSGNIFGQWSWTGSKWAARTIKSEVIANLDVGKLVVTGSSRFAEAVVDRLFADIFAAHKITANEITIAALDENGELAPGSVGAITLQNGIVGADAIIATEVAAEVSNLVKARVENLTVTDGALIDSAVILALASEMITAGVLRTSEAGQRVVIDQAGVTMIGIDPDGNDYELVRLGPAGENLLTIGETTIAPAGVASPRVDAGELTVGGVPFQDVIAPLPRSVEVWGQVTEASAYDSSNKPRRRAEIQCYLEPGRLYEVSLSAHYLEQSYTAPTAVVEYLHYSFDGVPIFPESPGAGVMQGMSATHYLPHGRAYTVPGTSFILDTSGWSGRRTFWCMYSLSSTTASAPVRLVVGPTTPLTMTVEDLGAARPGIVKRWNDNNSGGGQDAGTTVQRFTKEYVSTGYRTYNADGGEARTARGPVPDVVHGSYAGAPSNYNRRGGWTFPVMTGDLAGATIEKIEVYAHVNQTHSSSGSTVNIATWGGTMATGLTAVTSVYGWRAGTGKWITLPSSTHNGFRSGTIAGFGVRPTSTSTSQYARFAPTGARIRITYRK